MWHAAVWHAAVRHTVPVSRPDDRPVDLRRAIASHALHAARHVLTAWYATPFHRSLSRREAAFRRYFGDVGASFRSAPRTWQVAEIRPVTDGSAGDRRITEITLTGPLGAAPPVPGDMVALLWRNPDSAVARALPALAPTATTPVAYWTTPRPCRPARRSSTSAETFLREAADLGEGVSSSRWTTATTPRLAPRLYTLSEVAREGDHSRLRIMVSFHADWPERAAAHLLGLRVGEEVRGWVLPHPRRVPGLVVPQSREPIAPEAAGPGLAVVTGSGIAGVLAALRAGVADDLWLVWGTRHPVAPWLLQELETYRAAGLIGRLDVVVSAGERPRRVTDVLDDATGELARRLTRGDWIYVSGHTATLPAVRERVQAVLGPTTKARIEAMRYIESG